ncbi:VOC family protein [Aquimarina sp. ERC-38]|uniref:VOC family protein n=1 Tax=Aquimarina sp. ERC-38 TaxID=2949996 RepID=UPI002247837E|nr:VOC family protein [Aquimarina sp. ERC-38]UZO81409.1 VOC family protein [Aquimarina sp. ERC-38]
MNRFIINILSKDLGASSLFYHTLFDLKTTFESDWYIQLKNHTTGFEIGFLAVNHHLVPNDLSKNPGGAYLTFVVNDVEESFRIATEKGYRIVQEPTDTFYGQKRMLLTGPDGTLIDISSLLR